MNVLDFEIVVYPEQPAMGSAVCLRAYYILKRQFYMLTDARYHTYLGLQSRFKYLGISPYEVLTATSPLYATSSPTLACTSWIASSRPNVKRGNGASLIFKGKIQFDDEDDGGVTAIETQSCPWDEITLEGDMDRRLLRAETGAARETTRPIMVMNTRHKGGGIAYKDQFARDRLATL
jgi:hypothetical protein